MSRFNLLNIRRDTVDPHYRYKMPVLESKRMPKGKGGRTLLVNIADVAGALHRDGEEICRFISYELGVSSIKYDPNTAAVKGLRGKRELQDLVYAYIDKFVLCPNCHDPETNYIVAEGPSGRSRDVELRHFCSACAADEARTRLVDPGHKLCKFILNRLQANGGDKKGKKSSKSSKRKSKKKGKKKKGSRDSSAGSNDGDGGGAGGADAESIVVHGGYSWDACDPDVWAADFAAAAAATTGQDEEEDEDDKNTTENGR